MLFMGTGFYHGLQTEAEQDEVYEFWMSAMSNDCIDRLRRMRRGKLSHS